MGLPFGPGCDLDFKLPDLPIFPGGIFGPNPCLLFGGCTKPPPGPPPNRPPGDEWSDEGCGPLGCKGYCYVEGGCDKCPPEICGGPLCTRPGGCGPRPGSDPTPEPTRKPSCDEKDKTTVTERFVTCYEDLKLAPTTIASIDYTQTETISSACISLEATYTGCGLLGVSTTTTVSSFTSTSSEAAMCTRAPLDLNNDEGDNPQPSRTIDGPSCTRAPLLLDDDEGDNEQPANPWNSTIISSNLTSATSSSFLSLSTSNMTITSSSFSASSTSNLTITSSSFLSSSTLNMATRTSSTSTGTSTPNCSTCDKVFKDCANKFCKQDGSNAVDCAKFCLTYLCYADHGGDYCKKGPCKPAACPKEQPDDLMKGEPAIPFTTTLSLSSTQLTVTATSDSAVSTPPPTISSTVTTTPTGTTVSISYSPTPTCEGGHHASPNGKWTALIEQEIHRGYPSKSDLSFKLWDEYGCEAGTGGASNNILGHNILLDINSQSRPEQDSMPYTVHANVSDSLDARDSHIEFRMSKWVNDCKVQCWPKWKINSEQDSKPWQISEDCSDSCGSAKLTIFDITCSDTINKWHESPDSTASNTLKKRGGYCTWRMPYIPGASPSPPPTQPWTRSSRWTLNLIQWMEHTQSSLEWWLIDPSGHNASHFHWDTSTFPLSGSTSIDPTDPSLRLSLAMHYNMRLTVSYPRNKDTSTLRITYQNPKNPHCKYCARAPCEVFGVVPECQPFYQTETNDEKGQSLLEDCYSEKDGKEYICPSPMLKDNKEFSCEKVADAFKPVGAGFERRFRCWWPHDFVEPYGVDGGKGVVEVVDGGAV